MRVNNKRKHAHQMRANVCFGAHFLTRVCAKIVHAFCVCVGRLSLTWTVTKPETPYWNANRMQNRTLRERQRNGKISAELERVLDKIVIY